MSDRRSHWDIDLVEGVGRRLIPHYRSIGYCTDGQRHRIYTMIEFVEDWQEREKTRCKSATAYHCATHDTQWLDDESDRCEYKRMVVAEAAIARVREVCADEDFWAEGGPEAELVRAVTVEAVFTALDGAS